MVDRPYKPFNDSVKNIEPEPKTPNGPINPYPSRDKDNTAYVPKPPTWGIAGTSRQGPLGTLGYRQAFQDQQRNQPEIEITRGDPEKHGWVHGRLTDGSNYRFSAKLTPVPTRHGLDGGKIEKLALREENGYVAAFYDKQWLEKPETWRDQQAVTKIQDVFDGKDKEFTPIVPKSNEKDKGRDR